MKKLIEMLNKENTESNGSAFDRLQHQIFVALAEYQLEMENSRIIEDRKKANKQVH